MASTTDLLGPGFPGSRAKVRKAAGEKVASGIPLVMFILGCVALDWRFSESEVNIGNILFLFSCVAAWLAVFITERGRLRLRTWNMVDTIFLAYVILIVASTYWSVVPAETLSQSIFIGGMWATTLLLGSQPTERLVSYLVHTAFWIAILSLIATLITPDAFQPRTGELRGVYFHQLRLGLFMAIALGLLGIAVLNGRSSTIVKNKLVLAIYVVVLSATCIWAYARLYTFFAVVAFVITVMLPNNVRLRVVFLGLMAILIGWLVLDQNSILGGLGDQGVDLSLSGRTTIWERSLALVRDRANLGFGFASFDAHIFDGFWRGYRPLHPHNSYIQAFFENGWPGLILTLALGAAHFRIGLMATGAGRSKSYSLFLVLTAVLGALTGSVYSGKLTAFFALVLLAVSVDVSSSVAIKKSAKRDAR